MANVPVKGQTEFNTYIGQRIAQVIEERGLTDEKLAKMIIVERDLTDKQLKKEIEKTRISITRYRNGQRQCPTVVLKRIAEACNVSVDYLFGLSPTMTNDPDFQNACNLTGLDEKAITRLQMEPRAWQIDKEVINEILCNRDFYKMAKAIYTAQLLNRNEAVKNKTFPQTVSVSFADPKLGGLNIVFEDKDSLVNVIKTDATTAYHRMLEELTGKENKK